MLVLKKLVLLAPIFLASVSAAAAQTRFSGEGRYRLHLVQISGFAGQPSGPNGTGDLLEPLANELVIYARTLKRPAFVGHSMGGLLGLMVAARANDAMCATSYAGLPNKKLTRVDGAFHFLMLDQPAAFASILDTFLEGK